LKGNTSTSRNSDELAVVLAGNKVMLIYKMSSLKAESNVDVNPNDNNVSNHEPVSNLSHTDSPSVDEELVILNIHGPLN
jgi:hypothetical protein